MYREQIKEAAGIIKVLIVDDSALLRSILKEVINNDNNLSVIGEAKNGKEAIEKNILLKPDLITMDISMPIMNGLKATQKIMEDMPTAILILSNEIDSDISFKALKYGALDVLKKPELTQFNDTQYSEQFIKRLMSISKVQLQKVNQKNIQIKEQVFQNREFKILVIGASTGGPMAIKTILKELPANFPMGILVIQHLETGFDSGYASWLNEDSPLNVKLAKDNDLIKPSEVLVAPTDRHLTVINNRVYLNNGPKVLNQKPSIDVAFKSVSENFGNSVIGVLLTGMGKDGAEGLLTIKSRSGYTIAQDKDTSTIFGMPKAAIEMDSAVIVLPLDYIPKHITKLAGF